MAGELAAHLPAKQKEKQLVKANKTALGTINMGQKVL